MSAKLMSYLLAPLVAMGASADESTRPPIEIIVQRMAQARVDNQGALRAYSVKRHYTLVGKKGEDAHARVSVQIDFTPPSTKKFVIQESSGTRFGERAVRQMLEHETSIVKNQEASDMSLANYEFRLIGNEMYDSHPCFVLSITPRRKDKTLLKGRIWVDTNTYRLRRTEGAPAKDPSWWLRDSSIVFIYEEVDGMWLQTASESTADVRFVGRFSMLSQDLEYIRK